MKPRSVHSPEYRILVSLLRAARAESGLTQRALAAKLEKPYSYVGKIETSERELNVIELMDYCNALDIDPIGLIRNLQNQIYELRQRDSSL